MIAMNQELFSQHINSGEYTLVDFWAPWCVYCRRIAPALEKLAQEQEGNLIVGKINIDDHPQLAQQEGIEVIPTLLLYKDGQVVGSIVAPESKAAMEAFLQEHM